MCRIYGYLNATVPADRLATLPLLLQHGGPDGRYLAGGETWALGATRLAVTDPTGGDQPYRLGEQISVVFNGEIYNHDDLREELEAFGYKFPDRCDGSILPALYHRYGRDFTEHLDGMYGIAVLDLRGLPTLILATDEAGMKPIYYHRDGDQIFFSSEIGALRSLADIGGHRDIDGLDAYLSTRVPFGERTMFADVHVLPPAATAVVTANGGGMTIQERRKWTAQAVPSGLGAAADLVGETLRAETERLSIADVPVAAVTSGGLDSSFVTALLAGKLPGLVGFHVRYQGHWPFDEVVFARELANQHKLRLHEVELDAADFPDMLDDVVRHLGQPNADPITVSTFALFRAVRAAGFRVALTGDGADEFFAGYDRVKTALLDGDDWADRYVAALAAVPAQLRWQLYSEDYQEHLRLHGTTQRRLVEILRGRRDRLCALTEFEVGQRMPAYHLRRVDHLSMASAVEARMPFCQPAMASLALSLSDDCRVQGQSGKRALYAAAEGLVPQSVIRRPKQPFTLPVTTMLTGVPQLWSYARDVLAPSELAAAGELNPQSVQRLLADHEMHPNNVSALAIWALLIYQLWVQQISKPASAPASVRVA